MKHRGVRIEKETARKTIAFLVDVDPEFVSLVRHGANQQPFRVVKSDEKGGDDLMGMIIQSILLPEGVTIEELAAKKDLGWLAEVATDNVTQHGEYTKLIQKDESEFEPESLNMAKLDDTGAFAMVGKLKKPSEKDALTLGRTEAEKLLDIPASPMTAPVAEEVRPNYIVTFGEMFEKELHSFLDVVRGSLSQSSADLKKRKKTVMDALDAFKSFLAIVLDAIGSEKVETKKAEEVTEMFKDREEFAAAVAEVIGSTVPDLIDNAMKSFREELTPPADPPTADPPTEDDQPSQELADLTAKVEGFQEKLDALGQQLAGEPAVTDDDEPPVEKVDDPLAEAEVEGGKPKEGTFSGLLIRKTQAAA
jgi:hypothetical protein